jgi:DNA-3-methyladenine glycosylase I
LELQNEFESFSDFLWKPYHNKPIINRYKKWSDIPAISPESIEMSKSLIKHGFKFIGPTICYAFMQSVGMVNDHEMSCYRYTILL